MATSFSSLADLGKHKGGVQEPSDGFPEGQHSPSCTQSSFQQPGFPYSNTAAKIFRPDEVRRSRDKTNSSRSHKDS